MNPIWTTALLTTAALITLAPACAPPVDDDPEELGAVAVSLTANDPSTVTHFDLSVRPLTSMTWTTQTLPAMVVAPRAEASSVLSLTQGEYVLRAEAFNNGALLGQPREVRVTILPGFTTPVLIALDLADEPDEGGGAVTVTVSGENGANIDQSSLSDPNPTATTPATLTIDAVSDFEGDPIRTGFVGYIDMVTPEFFSETSTQVDFNLYPVLGPDNVIYAVAVDDSGFGTAHAYHFDSAATPSFQSVSTYRVNDVQRVNGGDNDVIVMSTTSPPSLRVLVDFDGDGVSDAGFESNDTLLSWGLGPIPGTYTLRARDAAGTHFIYTADMNNGVLSSVVE